MEKHTVEAKWRQAEAAALEVKVEAISHWLEHTEDLLQMFTEDDQTSQDLRGAVGIIKMRSNDFLQKAETIRAELADHDGRPD